MVAKKGSLVYVSKECTMITRTHILKSKIFQTQYVFLESLEAVNTWRYISMVNMRFFMLFHASVPLNGLPFKGQPHKMVKHTQTIRRQKPTNWLSVFDHFMGLALKWLK